ncbi:MAG: tRNA lysidine(34) synthetase TilS [Acidobacteriota bacterium]|nr:tRNA lysidine(34) synthetase TilS [Acidobacteriota bacterium]
MPAQALQQFFDSRLPLRKGDLILVAFSGGPDSTALLAAFRELSVGVGFRLHAAHLDHRLDPGSTERADHAEALARRLGVPLWREARAPGPVTKRGESLEEAARRLRYAFLEEVRGRLGARFVATGHHRDDQAETVVLRMLLGSGPAGLAAIAPHRGRLVRPLIDVPRRALRAYLAGQGLEPSNDPTNQDLRRPRNRVRHKMLPILAAGDDSVGKRLAGLAATAARATARIDRELVRRLHPTPLPEGAEVNRSLLEQLPHSLVPAALALLHRMAKADNPPGRGSVDELRRQLARQGEVGWDCGAGWRLESHGIHLRLTRVPMTSRRTPRRFAYTLSVPGEVWLPEVGGKLVLRTRKVEHWMFAHSQRRAALALPLATGDAVTIRSRRPGDRIRPFGCEYSRRLKNVLIDRKIPRLERDRIPLLCLGENVAWVPGVTIDDRYRLSGESEAWVAELEKR